MIYFIKSNVFFPPSPSQMLIITYHYHWSSCSTLKLMNIIMCRHKFHPNLWPPFFGQEICEALLQPGASSGRHHDSSATWAQIGHGIHGRVCNQTTSDLFDLWFILKKCRKGSRFLLVHFLGSLYTKMHEYTYIRIYIYKHQISYIVVYSFHPKICYFPRMKYEGIH